MIIGDSIIVANRSPNRRKGCNIVAGMTGRIVRVIPAGELFAAEPGERARVECEFKTRFGGPFRAWVSSREIRAL